ncbi:MAG: DinB family protein [Actinomycetota bacterium]
MTIDFAAVRARASTLAMQVAELTVADLVAETEQSIGTIEGIIQDATDADVVFVPEDPEAVDMAAAADDDRNLAWTLGHLIVHVTASAEESAALASELARGVAFHGRSRWEVPWQAIKTIHECRERLAESRRIRLASLQMWPDAPPSNVDPEPSVPSWETARERFARGLAHEVGHVEQIRDVFGQAKAARGA